MHFLDDTFEPDQGEERDVGNIEIYHFEKTFEITQILNVMFHQLMQVSIWTFWEPEIQ